MNVRRYFARTAREAMARVRAELGDDAIVLKNQPVDGGVEILALAGSELDLSTAAAMESPWSEPSAAAGGRRQADTEPEARSDAGALSGVAQETAGAGNRVPMSTVHFENYVRERQKKRKLPDHGRNDGREAASGDRIPGATMVAPEPAGTQAAAQAAQSAPIPAAPRFDTETLLTELRQMRGALSDQLEAMSWFEGVRRRPAQSRLLRHLLQSGFSPSLSRTLADHLPVDFGENEAGRWLREVLVRNLRIDAPEQTIFDDGGTFALLGPTGVGKTTTAAKIAAQFALRHGAQSVGLITADVYRIGAQDQLRTFGRLLGVPVHVAHDVSALADFLQVCMNRKLVLIDTAGVAQQDERVGELLSALSSAQVRKVLVLNAASQAEAIDETITAYQGRDAAGIVLSKVDEAVRLGGALDCLIRHRLTLQGVANGQRVPEDWHRPEPKMLVERALSAESSRIPASFAFEEAELAMLLSAVPGAVAGRGGKEHARGTAHV